MSDGNIIKFPVGYTDRERNLRGRRSVSCMISGRYLVFGQRVPLQEDCIYADLYTEVEDEESGRFRTRKLCSLLLPIDDLRRVLDETE